MRISKYQLEVYIPRAIREIRERVPDKVERLYSQYPFEKYGDPVIRRRLRKCGIREHQLAYQECYDAGMEAYLYSIHRCALCDYEYVEYYIWRLVSLAVIWSLNVCYEGRNICRENHLRQIELDSLERPDLW